ncbi:methyltransferase domain-containing protein [Mariniflexile gromovii]|uniref:tRNA (guanine(46)-N(7))-methyltransferase n=1 Tax=Mariniflexile gromovii TaxID=362523 RepID=A0ABS4BQW0_9FLAO|nr:methyltransferase domain-containing protein [Mariniflexile gromovii]MBP0902487.1 methyltransferase domain-containing protein [Mariniflexile gromovii]
MIGLVKKVYSILLKIRNNIYIIKEKRQGLDFTEVLSLEQLGLSDENSYYYQTAGSNRVKKILSSMSITENDNFIDFGCGKGKILYIISKNFPFRKVDGVEISKKLCDIAIDNMKKLNVSNVNIYNEDAVHFTDIDIYNYIYFYNPFPATVMKSVMDNIGKSLERVPRKVTIIYFNPTCHDQIISSGTFKGSANKWRVFVYKNF